MSLETVQNLSIPDLLRLLNEKLSLERTRLQKYHPPVIDTASLETEIESLETGAREALGIIPSLRNLLQSVNRLPPEILSRVARCFLSDVTAVDARCIVPLTHVCRYWRRSIISDSTNWSMISNHSESLTALSLERAREAPLEIRLGPSIRGVASCRLPTPCLRNIVALHITYYTTIGNLRGTIPDFPRSMPNLRSLELESGPQWNHSFDPFESLTPTLKHLGLRNIPLYPSILRLKSLTELKYINFLSDNNVHLGTVLDFLEGNHSLSHVTLGIKFGEAPLSSPRHRAAIENKLRYLSINCRNTTSGQALISRIALRRGAHLRLVGLPGGLKDILSDLSITHLQNLRSPTLMEYRSHEREILLTGPNGRFSSRVLPTSGIPFVEFPLLPLSHIRKFYLVHVGH